VRRILHKDLNFHPFKTILNTSLKERLEGQEGREGDLSSCWMTLRKQMLEVEGGTQDRTVWRTQFGRGYGPVARQTTT
jgi:hypothetical protein